MVQDCGVLLPVHSNNPTVTAGCHPRGSIQCAHSPAKVTARLKWNRESGTARKREAPPSPGLNCCFWCFTELEFNEHINASRASY